MNQAAAVGLDGALHTCGGHFRIVLADADVRIGHRRVRVPEEMYRCDACGEERQTPDQIDRARRAAAERLHSTHQFLTPPELRRIREERLELTQAQLERALGLGEKTIVRWETGRVVPSKAVDNLFRIFDREPRLIGYLATLHNYELPPYARCAREPGVGSRISIARSLMEQLERVAQDECVSVEAIMMVAVNDYLRARMPAEPARPRPGAQVAVFRKYEFAQAFGGRTPPFGTERFADLS